MAATVNTDFLNQFVNDWHLLADMADFICGGVIGEGTSRSVYEFRLSPGMVIKIEKHPVKFNNVAEWEIWNNFKDDKNISKFLAPCVNISSCGRLLVQERTEPCTIKELPKSIPNFFADFKIQNWGKLNGRCVCHDYANHSFFNASKISMMQPVWCSDVWIPTSK